jgi:hypothetical protein
MDDLFLLWIFIGAFSLALVAGEGLIALWRKFRQRMLFPRNRWF